MKRFLFFLWCAVLVSSLLAVNYYWPNGRTQCDRELFETPDGQMRFEWVCR